MYKKQIAGKLGEDIACEYLKKQGYDIIERNFRIRGGEIDIIALDKGVLAFIEVKTRRSNEFGSPLESITPWKLRALIKSAQFYKIKHPKTPDEMRIDAVAIILDHADKPVSIELVKNISG